MPAEFIEKLEDASAKVEEDAVFKCKTDDDEAPVEWFINGKPVEPSERHVITSDGVNHSLTIKAVQAGEDCEVSVTLGDTSSAACLHVQGTSIFTLCSPVIWYLSKNIFFCFFF